MSRRALIIADIAEVILVVSLEAFAASVSVGLAIIFVALLTGAA